MNHKGTNKIGLIKSKWVTEVVLTFFFFSNFPFFLFNMRLKKLLQTVLCSNADGKLLLNSRYTVKKLFAKQLQ